MTLALSEHPTFHSCISSALKKRRDHHTPAFEKKIHALAAKKTEAML
jgi:hypothetical protein